MKIKMKLLSDAIPGSGEGTAGLVDTDISHDEFGLPIIPAKRIKGILRESSRDLEDANVFAQGKTPEIFGTRGNKIGTEFKISDGYLENYSELKNFLQFCSADKQLPRIFNREAVLNFYTYTRSQTGINENGVAQDDTLRTFRVLRKGLVFYFDTEYPMGWESDIETICKVTCKFGISRTRGTGELLLTMDKSKQSQDVAEATFHEEIKDEDLCRLNLSIHNIGQLIVTIQVGKDQITENYIPGTFILGTMANAFIKHFGLNSFSAHRDPNFRNIFLNENIIFSNGYPSDSSDKEPCYPCPVSIVREKDKENCFDMANELFDFDKIVKEKIQTKGNIGEFVQIYQGEVSTRSVLTQVAYHHQRPPDRTVGHAKEGQGEFFQFTVLRPDQCFISHIIGKYKYLKVLNDIINKKKIFYLGKSKTAQYGKCIFEGGMESLTDSYSDEWQQGESAVFTLESDMILRNENGLTVPDSEILKNEIAEVLKADKKKMTVEKSFLKFRQIGGYSGVWNMPKIQTPALAAGSVIVCKNNGDDLGDVFSLENHSFGIRTDEGFGKIKVHWHGQDEIVLADDKEQDKPSAPDNLEKSEALIQYILYRRLEDALKDKAVNHAEKARDNISNSFIGKMTLFINTSENFDKLNEKFSELKERATKQLDKIASYLFLKASEKKKFSVDEGEFIGWLKILRDSQNIPHLRNIFNNASMNEDFYKDNIFKLYQTGSIHFLTLLRLHNRKAGKSGKR